MDTQGELLALRLNRLSPGLAAATSTRPASPSAGKRPLLRWAGDRKPRSRATEKELKTYRSTTTIFGRSNIMVKLRSMLERLETATGNYWRASAAKNVFKSHEPLVDARDLVAYAFKE
jgi:hypothetical protein